MGVETVVTLIAALFGTGGLYQFLTYRAKNRSAEVDTDSVIVAQAQAYVELVAGDLASNKERIQHLEGVIAEMEKRHDAQMAEVRRAVEDSQRGALLLFAQIVELGERPVWIPGSDVPVD